MPASLHTGASTMTNHARNTTAPGKKAAAELIRDLDVEPARDLPPTLMKPGLTAYRVTSNAHAPHYEPGDLVYADERGRVVSLMPAAAAQRVTSEQVTAWLGRCLAARVWPVVSQQSGQVRLVWPDGDTPDPERLAELDAWLDVPEAREAVRAWLNEAGERA